MGRVDGATATSLAVEQASTEIGITPKRLMPPRLVDASAEAWSAGGHPVSEQGRRVVHLVGCFKSPVHRLLAPTTEALRRAGYEQAVLLIEDPASPRLAEDLHPSIKLVMLPGRQSIPARWHAWVRAARMLVEEAPTEVMHLHGFIPAALASALLASNTVARRLYSPHGSRLHQSNTRAQALLGWLIRPFLAHVARAAVVSMPTEARVLHRLQGVTVSQVNAPVDPIYFNTPRVPARHPLVVGGEIDATPEMASRFAQVAVLMGNGERGLAFNWLGAAEGEALEQLQAANIGLVDLKVAAARASRLGAAWIYVCAHTARGFPGHLVEAMAMGVPVVALDSPAHRDVVTDGETGFLCRDERELVTRSFMLIEDPALHANMSERARITAQVRFEGGDFDASIVKAYAG